MNTVLQIISMSSDYFATVFLLFVLYMLYPAKRFIKHPWALYEIVSALAVMLLFVSNVLEINSFYANTLLFPVVGLAYVLAFLDDNPFCMSAVVLLFFSAQLQLTTVFSNLCSFFFPDVFWLSIISSRVLPRLCLIPLYFFVKRFRVPGKERIPLPYWLAIAVTSLASALCLMVFLPGRVEGEGIEILLATFAACFFITNILIYFLFYRVTRDYRERMERQAMDQRLALNRQHADEVQSLYQNLREIRHDLLNHITVMDGMIRQQQYGELDAYFQTLRKNNQSIEQFIDCGHVSVNALINPKLSYAKGLGIRISVEAALPPRVQIAETDLCTVLANLLDNAIEACGGLPEPAISLRMRPERSYLSIIVRNTAAADALSGNPSLQTTKPDKQYHGMGLNIVRSVAGKYDGAVSFEVIDGFFTAKVLLLDQAPSR